MAEVIDREIVFGDIAKVPRICSPQIWTVAVDADVPAAQIIASTPSHVIHCTAKLQQGLYSLATLLKSPDSSSKVGTVGSTVDFKGVTGKIVGVSDTVDGPGRKQMIAGVLKGVEDARRCRLGPFPRNWFIPDKIKNSKKKLPLYPKNTWITMLKHYGDLEKIWLLQEGNTKVFLICLFTTSSGLSRLLTDGLGRYVRMPKNIGARPLEVTIVQEDDTPIAVGLSGQVDIPDEIDGVSTRGMSSMQYLAFQALEQRVEMLEKENLEMKDLLRDLQLAEIAAAKAEQRDNTAGIKPSAASASSSRKMGMVQRHEPDEEMKPSRHPRKMNPTNHPWKAQVSSRASASASASAAQAAAPVMAAQQPQQQQQHTTTRHSGAPPKREGNVYTHPPMVDMAAQPQQPHYQGHGSMMDASGTPMVHHHSTPIPVVSSQPVQEDNNFLTALAFGESIPVPTPGAVADPTALVPPPANARRTPATDFRSSFRSTDASAPWKGMAGRAVAGQVDSSMMAGGGLRRGVPPATGGAESREAPWKKLKTSGHVDPMATGAPHGVNPAAYPLVGGAVPEQSPPEEKPALTEKAITDYHNLLLGVQSVE